MDDIDRALAAAEAGFEIMLAHLERESERYLRNEWRFDDQNDQKWKFEFVNVDRDVMSRLWTHQQIAMDRQVKLTDFQS